MMEKKYLRNILIVIVLLIIFSTILFLILKNKKNNFQENSLNNGLSSENIEQVYLSNNYPVFDKDDHFLGSSNASLKIFVYEDNISLYSAELASTLDKIYFENKDDLAIIFRPFFSPRDVLSKKAALLVECAAEQNKWKEMRALLFEQAKNNSLVFENTSEITIQLNLDEEKLQNCLTSSDKYAKIEKLNEDSSQYGVSGAPTIFIGNEMIIGARPYDDYIDLNGDKIEGLKSLIEKKIE